MSSMDESIRRTLELQETIRKYAEPLAVTLNAVSQNSYLDGVTKSLKLHDEAMQSALRPFNEMCRLSAEHQAQFKIPGLLEAQNLFRQYEESGAVAAARHMQTIWDDQNVMLKQAMEAMSQPWLDAQNIARSFSGFAEIQSIGYALRTTHPFEDRFSEQLRASLGNWQTPLSFVPETLVDSLARTELYLARGFDSALTDFPPIAFLESTSLAGLRPDFPTFADDYDDRENAIESTQDDVEESFIRTNAAHNRLMRFETQVRHFIDKRMTAAFGPKWIKQRVPGPIWQGWEEKRLKALEAGDKEHPLIAYADFTDYVVIITRKDNWEAVFEPVFRRPVLVQESFQRLYPIRICTMHARLITQDDELYLFVETKCLLKAMEVSC